MSERIKKIIGADLYAKVEEAAKVAGIKVKDIDLIPNNFVTVTRFNEVNSELKTSKEKITSYENQNSEVEKLLKGVNSENVGDLIGKFTTMKDTHKTELDAKDKEIANISKSSKVKDYLNKEGAKHTDLLMKSINLDDIKIDGDKLLGISDVVKTLKTDYKDLFVVQKDDGKPPKDTGAGAGGAGGEGGKDKSEDDIFSQLIKGNSY
jgi:hypothetical protein